MFEPSGAPCWLSLSTSQALSKGSGGNQAKMSCRSEGLLRTFPVGDHIELFFK